MTDPEIAASAEKVVALARTRHLKIATAESCTGGLVIAALTDIPGSSEVVERGFVTYSNAAKRSVLGVPAATLESYGAVSSQTAAAMVTGALTQAPVDLAVAVTGIAGPGGGTPAKPVGLVHIAAAGATAICCSRSTDLAACRAARFAAAPCFRL